MNNPHRLATIMFADIAGYTALMEKDENAALEFLKQFQSSLRQFVPSHQGKIRQFYGDGCLAVFQGTTDALHCAITLQKDFWSNHQIPVRIGIHTGEVVFGDNNVFGNAVNIASRIESIGIPGSILFSKNILDQITNKLDFNIESLGTFQFKNVSKPVEVYAVADFGLQVPDREHIKGKLSSDSKTYASLFFTHRYFRYFLTAFLVVVAASLIFYADTLTKYFENTPFDDIEKEGLYIPPFVNNTGDTTLNDVGNYASMVISTAIQSAGLVKVREVPTLEIGAQKPATILSDLSYSPGDPEYSGNRYVLSGKYHLKQDSLEFITSIIDQKNTVILHNFPRVIGYKTDYQKVVSQLKEEILGFWATRKNPLLQNNPPSYQGYRYYLQAIDNWEGDPEETLSYIQKSKESDPTFYRAYLLELALYENEDLYKADSMLTEMEKLKKKLSKEELNLYNALSALVNENNKAAYNYYMNELDNAPTNLFVNTSAISYALLLVNDAKKAIDIAEKIDWRKVPYNDCHYCQDRLTVLASAYISDGQEEKALDLLEFAESMETDVINSGIKELEIRALVRKDRKEDINTLLQKARHQKFNRGRDYLYFYFWTAREYCLANNMDRAKEFTSYFQTHIPAEYPEKYGGYLGRLHLFFSEYQEAEMVLQRFIQRVNLGNWKPYYESLYHMALGFQGEKEKVATFIQSLDQKMDERINYHYLYYQGLLYVSIGEHAAAISKLKEALFAGKRFYRWEFQYDPLLHNHLPEKSFQEVLQLLH